MIDNTNMNGMQHPGMNPYSSAVTPFMPKMEQKIM